MSNENIDTTQVVIEVTAPVDDMAVIMAELNRLRQENAKLKDKTPSGGIKVSEKGGISVYGLARFPITMYEGQWAKLLAMSEELKTFIAANKDDPRVVKARTEHEGRKAK